MSAPDRTAAAASPTRRRFLAQGATAVALCGAAGALGAACGNGANGQGGGAGAGGVTDTGLTVADLAVGQCRTPSGAAFVVARDAMGFYAYSNHCTHEGCTVPCPDADGLSTCPCHGAEFDANGDNVLPNHGASGNLPDLPHYVVRFEGAGEGARVLVDTGTTVDVRTTRAEPPPPATDADAASAADAAG